MRTQRLRSIGKRLTTPDPGLGATWWLENPPDHLNRLTNCDRAWISNIIDAEWRPALPKLQTSADAILQV